MNKMTFSGLIYGQQITLERISKKAAKKLHTQGETIYIQSSKIHPLGVWSQAMTIPIDFIFEDYVDYFEFYNCSFEQGYYASFYKKI